MTTDLMPFAYEGATVRTVVIDGDPWFVLADLCRILEIANPSSVVARLDPQSVNTLRLAEGNRGNPNVTIVNEPGMYEVVIRSDKPEAAAFRRWITSEVLPTIRKTGGYGQAVERLSPLEYARQLVAAEERAELLQARALVAEAQIESERPLVERAKTHAAAAGEKTRQQFFREVKQWAHDNHGVEVKQAQVVEFLSTRKLGLFIRGNRSDSGQATAWAIEKGYAVNREDTALNGHNYVTGKLTARGQEYAWERIFRHLDANGTLDLPRQIGAAS